MQPTITTREQIIRQAMADALRSGYYQNNITVKDADDAISVLNHLGFRVVRAYAQPSVSGPLIADAITFEQIRQAGLEDLPVNIIVHFAGVETDGHNLMRLTQQLLDLSTVNSFTRVFQSIYGHVSPAGETPAELLLSIKPVRNAIEETIRSIAVPVTGEKLIP